MVYITGDTHGTEDWEKLNTRNFSEQKFMHPDNDYVIIVGDFGGVWASARAASVRAVHPDGAQPSPKRSMVSSSSPRECR